MPYHELHISITPNTENNRDIITAQLADLGYESFMEADDGLLAYIKAQPSHCASGDMEQVIIPQGVSVTHSTLTIQDQNWNALWESNFSPITVDDRCMVRASFHEPLPGMQHDIVIDPKMAFGTGHHQTTHQMISALLNTQVAGKTMLDMGCGTGVLAILAEKLGASSVVAIDNDEWAYSNTLENIERNSCTRVKALLGDASAITGGGFDIILANINLNILLADMQEYIKHLNPNGLLLTSGILSTDTQQLIAHAQSIGLKHIYTTTRDSWAMVAFTANEIETPQTRITK